jgi:hypothetical protein
MDGTESESLILIGLSRPRFGPILDVIMNYCSRQWLDN